VLRLLLIAAGGGAVGIVLGFLGGGGAILTVPLLLLLGIEPKPAIALSLGVVAATASVAAARHARAGNVDARAAALFAPAAGAGSYVGGRMAAWLPGEVLLLVFTGLMLAAAGAMLRPAPVPATAGGRRRVAWLVGAGTAVGALTGLVGAGGGFLYVPLFALLGGMPMHRAVGTSVVVIALSALAGLAGHLGHVTFPIGAALPLAAASAAGAWAGSHLATRTPDANLRRAFGAFLVLVAAWMLWRSPLLR
jgi:hypothetical protein